MSTAGHPSDTQRAVHENLLASLRGISLLFSGDPSRDKEALPQAESVSPRVIPLPYEIYLTILRRYIKSLINTSSIRQYRLQRNTFAQRRELVPVMLVSRAFGKLVHNEWNRYWPASRLLAESRWMLARPNVFFERFIQPVDLSAFARLRFASLDFKDAFVHRDHTWQLIALVAKLPASLKQIELLRVHAPEHELIDLVSRLCPDITTLRLVFCTMFNNPRCTWWAMHQRRVDHGHYMKGHELAGVKAYARTIGRALRYLPRLKHFHLGVYFASLQAIDTHRLAADHIKCHPVRDSIRWIDHLQAQSPAHFQAVWTVRHPTVPPPDISQPCLADQKLWETPCGPCLRQWREHTKRAEELAASVLAAERPSLRTVSFASFVAEKRTSPSEWEVCRSDIFFSLFAKLAREHSLVRHAVGAQVQVWTKPVREHGSGRVHVFKWSDVGWEHAGHAWMILGPFCFG